MTLNAAKLSELAATWGPLLITLLVGLGIRDIGAAAIRQLVKLWGEHVKKTPDKRDDVAHAILSPGLLAVADLLESKGEKRAADLIRAEAKR